MLEQLIDESLERIILHTLAFKDAVDEIRNIVKPEYFYNAVHIDIYKAMLDMNERLEDISVQTVAIKLGQINMALAVEFRNIVAFTLPEPNIKILVPSLVELHNKRELFNLSKTIVDNLKTKTSSNIVKEIETAIDKLSVESETRAKNYAQWEEEVAKLPAMPKYQTGISFIDEALQGGITTGQFILVMGDPEAGKTLLTTQILRNTSNGFPVLFFCFEFTVRDFINQNIEKNRILGKENLQIIKDGYTLSDVEREIKIWAKKGVRFVLIDSQMRVDNSERNGSVEQQESEKFSKLAKLCHKYDLTILLIAQQGKEDTKGGVHTPMGSKKGGHEANQIWYIHKTKPDYDENGIDKNKERRDFEISKNKQNGRHFRTQIRLDLAKLEFVRTYDKQPTVTRFEGKTKNEKIKEISEDDIDAMDMPEVLL